MSGSIGSFMIQVWQGTIQPPHQASGFADSVIKAINHADDYVEAYKDLNTLKQLVSLYDKYTVTLPDGGQIANCYVRGVQTISIEKEASGKWLYETNIEIRVNAEDFRTYINTP